MGPIVVRKMRALKRRRVRRPGLRSPISFLAVMAVVAGTGGALSFAGPAGAVLPSPGVSPVLDLNGVPNQISLEAPFLYAIPSGASAAPAADWAFQLNDDWFSPLSSVWLSGDDFLICVSGGTQNVAWGG